MLGLDTPDEHGYSTSGFAILAPHCLPKGRGAVRV